MQQQILTVRPLWILVWLTIALHTSSAMASTTLYADAGAPSGGDGLSWGTAYNSVQQALDTLPQGGTLYTRGVFHENVRFPGGLNDVTWIGDSDPNHPTWMRGDRFVSDPSLWQIDTEFSNCLSIDHFTVAYDMEQMPGGVVYDYRRDDEFGSVTGIPIIRPWYGHLWRVETPEECNQLDGSWWYDIEQDRLLVNPPGEIIATDPSLITAVVRGQNAVLLPGNSGVRISGVNTMLTPTRVGNNGYGFKGTGQNNIIENSIIVDSGWHAAGFAIIDSFRNTLRNITVYGGSVPSTVNMNNPFVFYTTLNRPNSENVGEDLTFYAYPILHASGRPLFVDFNPRLGYSHAAISRVLGGIEWRRCIQIDFVRELENRHDIQMNWSGSFINAGSLPQNPTGTAGDAPLRIYDSIVIGPSARPSFAAYFNTIFDRRGFPQLSNGTITGTGSLWLIGCVYAVGTFNPEANIVFRHSSGTANYFIEATTIIADDPGMDQGTIFQFGSTAGTLHLRSSLVYYHGQGTLLRLGPNAWSGAGQIVQAANSALSGFDLPVRHTNPGVAPRNAAWWLANVSPDTRFDLQPEFVDLDSLQLEPMPGSPIATEFATPISEQLLQALINGTPYFGRFGHAQVPFDLDINQDGVADIEDLYAAYAPDADPIVVAIRRLIAARLRDAEPADVHP